MGLFSVDNPVQPKIVVISPAHVLQAVLRFMVPDEAGGKRSGSKNSICKRNDNQTALIEGSALHEGYEDSKDLRPYLRIVLNSRMMLGFSV